MSRVAAPRSAIDRLRELRFTSDRSAAEARGILIGLSAVLGFDADQVTDFDDGDEPALLVAEAAEEPEAPVTAAPERRARRGSPKR